MWSRVKVKGERREKGQRMKETGVLSRHCPHWHQCLMSLGDDGHSLQNFVITPLRNRHSRVWWCLRLFLEGKMFVSPTSTIAGPGLTLNIQCKRTSLRVERLSKGQMVMESYKKHLSGLESNSTEVGCLPWLTWVWRLVTPGNIVPWAQNQE